MIHIILMTNPLVNKLNLTMIYMNIIFLMVESVITVRS